METAILGQGSLDYRSYLDETSWVNMGVLQELFLNNDFMGSSQYFYKDVDPPGGRSLLYAGPVWDMDQTLGVRTQSYLPENVILMLRKVWYQDLCIRPEFHRRMVEVYRERYRSLLDELLEQGIDRMAEEIRPAAKMNYIRWSIVAEMQTGQRAHFLAEVAHLKDFLRKRVAFLDDYWDGETVYHTVRVTYDAPGDPSKHVYWYYMVWDGECLPQPQHLAASENIHFVGWYYGTPETLEGPFDPNRPVTEDLTVSARYEFFSVP